MPQDEVMRTEGLRKRYGQIEAVGGLDINLYAGEVFSFLGPNGSGKSTTVGMILGLVKPTAGRALCFGNDMATHAWPTLRRIGAMIEAPAFYPYLSGYDNLKVITIALGDIPDARIEETLELVGLTERAHSQYKTYSLGMKQRLGTASTPPAPARCASSYQSWQSKDAPSSSAATSCVRCRRSATAWPSCSAASW